GDRVVAGAGAVGGGDTFSGDLGRCAQPATVQAVAAELCGTGDFAAGGGVDRGKAGRAGAGGGGFCGVGRGAVASGAGGGAGIAADGVADGFWAYRPDVYFAVRSGGHDRLPAAEFCD